MSPSAAVRFVLALPKLCASAATVHWGTCRPLLGWGAGSVRTQVAIILTIFHALSADAIIESPRYQI